MSITVLTTRYTPEDLLKMPNGDRYELIGGKLIVRDRSFWSSYVSGNVLGHLSKHVTANRSGWVVSGGVSYQCFVDDPDRVRRADVSFIRLERLSFEQATEAGHIRIAPDLAVAVMSPNDTAYDVDEKVQDYLRAGVTLVWVVYPKTHTVIVHRRQGTGTVLGENDELTGEDVLPGFRCRVGDLFTPPEGLPTG